MAGGSAAEDVLGKLEEIREALVTGDWDGVNARLIEKRVAWITENLGEPAQGESPVRRAYRKFLLEYMGLDPSQVPVVHEDENRIIWRSFNRCPVLEACREGGFDTRVVCRLGYERSVQSFVQAIDPRLRFGRNYGVIRPYSPFCEECFEVVA